MTTLELLIILAWLFLLLVAKRIREQLKNRRFLQILGLIIFWVVTFQASQVIGDLIGAYFSNPSYRYGELTLSDTPDWQVIESDDILWNKEADYPAFRSVNYVVTDEVGRVWFPADGNRVAMYDGERWHHWWSKDIRAYRGFVSHETGAWGVLYGSNKMAWYNPKNNRWEIPWRFANDQEFNTFAIALNSQGSLFALSDGKIAVYNEGEWSYIHSSCPWMSTLSIDHFDHIWTWGPREHVICQYDGYWWYIYDLPLEAPPSFGPEHQIHFDSQGNLWTAVETNLILRTNSEQWYLYDKNQLPLAGEEIRQIAIDPQDRVWLVSRNYIAATDGQQWHVFSAADFGVRVWGSIRGAPHSFINFDKRGHLWIAVGSNKIARFSGEVPLGRFNQYLFIEQAKPLTVSVESWP